jgi:plasmid replication initiation protein
MSDAEQLDLFQVTAFDPPLRDSRDVMEYPFLSIQKGRRKPIEFISADRRVQLHISAPEAFGIATIWDWDLVIYLVANLNVAIENGYAVHKWVEFAPYDALRYMGRGTGGKDYRELVLAIRRLSTTNIITNIRQDDTHGMEGRLQWVTDYRIPKRYRANQFLTNLDDGEADTAQPWAVEVSSWILQSVVRRTEILAVHPDYFQLTGGLERWLYRLARKSVPDRANNAAFNFRMDTLYKRSGSTRPLRNFAGDIRKIAERQGLPEYGVHVQHDDRSEMVTLFRDTSKPYRLPRGVKLIIQKENEDDLAN